MAKFNGLTANRSVGTSPIQTKGVGTTTNHEGITANERTEKSDLFLLGVTNFVSEDTFYEDSSSRDSRYSGLVHEVTKTDPAWVASFVSYLRNEANMRSVAIVTAAEYVRAGGPNGRSVVASACLRADEPSEFLSYWYANYGRNLPAAVKRGLADAVVRLYNQKSFIKYDSSSRNFRFGDVIQLTHAKPKDNTQSALFKAAIDSRYGSTPDYSSLSIVEKYNKYNAMDRSSARKILLSDTSELSSSGMTWESLSSFGKMDAKAWEAIIPNMGYMALLRNLRNFDEAGVSDDVAAKVAARLADPDEVARSRQLVFRFYTAYKNAPSLRWSWALEQALNHATKNVPQLKGTSLILVDTSGSMTGFGYSEKSTVSPLMSAGLFGAALTKSGQNVDVKVFASSVADYNLKKGTSVLKVADDLVKSAGRVGHGTNIDGALRSYTNQDRVFLISDMQTTHYVSRGNIPTKVPIYGFNLGGYGSTVINSDKNMAEFGGLTDGIFGTIKAMESAKAGNWPWESK